MSLHRSGKQVVDRASANEELREGNATFVTKSSHTVGSHPCRVADETGTCDDFYARHRGPEVKVGSAEFVELITQATEIADAAALGERVVTEDPESRRTIAWPDAEAGSWRPSSAAIVSSV